ncbi:class I SAM-dependent methyltransferase [Nocardia sp. JMUB6875]|uniref:class I SAM-dependent methyltransferase n=1 Tax=Nocardia sp. JMUB6875 TaxID=3158170 RepID=UPI0032E62E65
MDSARERVDRVLTCCCDGPTLDLACGSGRLADRLVRQGVAALSVDLSPMAVAVTRSRGVPTLYRDIFDRLPGTGRWEYAILADGTVGLGGDPVRVLRRARELLAHDGVAIVEFAATGTTSRLRPTRLPCPPGTGAPVPWTRVGIDRAPGLAAAADLRILTAATVAGHEIAWLTPS